MYRIYKAGEMEGKRNVSPPCGRIPMQCAGLKDCIIFPYCVQYYASYDSWNDETLVNLMQCQEWTRHGVQVVNSSSSGNRYAQLDRKGPANERTLSCKSKNRPARPSERIHFNGTTDN